MRFKQKIYITIGINRRFFVVFYYRVAMAQHLNESLDSTEI